MPSHHRYTSIHSHPFNSVKMVINQFWDDVKMDLDFFFFFWSSVYSQERFYSIHITHTLFLPFSVFSLVWVLFFRNSIIFRVVSCGFQSLNMTCISIRFNATRIHTHSPTMQMRLHSKTIERIRKIKLLEYIDLYSHCFGIMIHFSWRIQIERYFWKIWFVYWKCGYKFKSSVFFSLVHSSREMRRLKWRRAQSIYRLKCL